MAKKAAPAPSKRTREFLNGKPYSLGHLAFNKLTGLKSEKACGTKKPKKK